MSTLRIKCRTWQKMGTRFLKVEQDSNDSIEIPSIKNPIAFPFFKVDKKWDTKSFKLKNCRSLFVIHCLLEMLTIFPIKIRKSINKY